MDMMQMAAQLLAARFGTKATPETIGDALGSLLGGTDGKADIAGLVTRLMASGDLKGLVSSWLGDGANAVISPQQISAVLGGDRVDAFASRLGIDSDSAAAGLAEVLPEVVDRSSSGGSLLSGDEALAGVLGAVKGFL